MSLYSTLWNYLLKIIDKKHNIKISISLAFGMLSKQKRETRDAEGGWYYRLLKLSQQGCLNSLIIFLRLKDEHMATYI